MADRVEVSQYRLATHLVLACIIYIAILWTAQRFDEQDAAPAPGAIRATALGLLVLVLGQIYLGALVAGLRAGYVYNTWPSIDGAFVPDASRLFFDVPVWRNFFENTLTVQFDHRMLAYTIWIVALIHAVNVARTVKTGPVVAGAIILAAAVTLQAALGIFTLADGGAAFARFAAPGHGDGGADGGDNARCVGCQAAAPHRIVIVRDSGRSSDR